MSIASEILRLQQAKQAIKESINNKGGTLTNESIDNYAQAIDNLPSGGGGMTYQDYARTLYLVRGKSNQFETAWDHSLIVDPLEISEDSVQSSPRGIAQYPNGETEGVIIPEGVTSIGAYAFYGWTSNNQPLVIPDSVKSIGLTVFRDWTSNNQPLVIPDSVKSIGNGTFQNWTSNNQPLVISNSVTSIGSNLFRSWTSNTHPIVIPDSVTIIRANAFDSWELVPYVEIKRITPPTLANVSSFDNQNDAPIYVPDESVNDYKTATNWVTLASRIFSINDK